MLRVVDTLLQQMMRGNEAAVQVRVVTPHPVAEAPYMGFIPNQT